MRLHRQAAEQFSHDCLLDFRVPAHSQIIIAAPDGYILPVSGRVLERAWKLGRLPTDFLEDPIRVVALLLLQFIHKEGLVVKQFGHRCWV